MRRGLPLAIRRAEKKAEGAHEHGTVIVTMELQGASVHGGEEVCVYEIIALEQQGFVKKAGQGVREAIA